jgi:hypothetical protein
LPLRGIYAICVVAHFDLLLVTNLVPFGDWCLFKLGDPHYEELTALLKLIYMCFACCLIFVKQSCGILLCVLSRASFNFLLAATLSFGSVAPETVKLLFACVFKSTGGKSTFSF